MYCIAAACNARYTTASRSPSTKLMLFSPCLAEAALETLTVRLNRKTTYIDIHEYYNIRETTCIFIIIKADKISERWKGSSWKQYMITQQKRRSKLCPHINRFHKREIVERHTQSKQGPIYMMSTVSYARETYGVNGWIESVFQCLQKPFSFVDNEIFCQNSK